MSTAEKNLINIRDVIAKLDKRLNEFGARIDTINGALSRHDSEINELKNRKDNYENLKQSHMKFSESYNTSISGFNSKFADISDRLDTIIKDLASLTQSLKRVDTDSKSRDTNLELELVSKIQESVEALEVKIKAVTDNLFF